MSIRLSLLGGGSTTCVQNWFEFLEEFWWLERMLTSDIMESSSRDVVSLTLTDERIIFQEISQFGWVEVGLFGQNLLRFTPKNGRLVRTLDYSLAE